MNLTPTQIIIIGAAIVFGLPITVGLIIGHLHGWFAGIVAGVLLFVFILAIAHRRLTKITHRGGD